MKKINPEKQNTSSPRFPIQNTTDVNIYHQLLKESTGKNCLGTQKTEEVLYPRHLSSQ